MKKVILKYNLEIFSFIVMLVLLIRFLFLPDLSEEHRILSAFMIMAIMHEYEEKRIPGGFFEMMSNKFGLPEEKRHFEKPGLCVTIYWTVILIAASFFPNPVLLILLSCLGLFEAFIHTAGIRIHRLSKPYTPGLVTAWIMAAVSVFTIRYLTAGDLAGPVTYTVGIILFILTFITLGMSVMRSFGMSFADIPKNIKSK